MQAKQKLSAVIITFNEADRIVQCLNSVDFCDEVIVVDSGSRDNTTQLAESAGAKVVKQEWLGYGRQKQFAVDQASNNWVLCIDADEKISVELRDSILKCLEGPGYSAYLMPRCNRFLGHWLKHGEGYPDKSLRFFDRQHARWSDDDIHEKVITSKPLGELDGDLLHESQDTLEKYLAKQNRYTTLQAEAMIANGKEVGILKLVVNPVFRFIKFYLIRKGFMDGLPGFVHIMIGCMNTFIKYAKVLEARKHAK